MVTHSRTVTGGAKLLWRRQRVFWWMYAVNFLLAVVATASLRPRVGAILDYSLAADSLVHGFDIPTFAALAASPGAPLNSTAPASSLYIFVFFVFMLFMAGGILEVYHRDQTMRAGEFFEACGRFFWRFVRLLLFLIIVLIPIVLFAGLITNWSGKLASNATQPLLGFWVELLGLLIVTLLLMAVRLWFDMAQIRAVAENERAMRRTLLQAFKITFGNFGSLFWIYLRLSILALAGLASAFWVWVMLVRPESIGVSFLLGQAAILLGIAIRLWLRASETRWYQERFAPTQAPAPLPPPTEAPEASALI